MTGEHPTPFDREARLLEETRAAQQQRHPEHRGGAMLAILAAIAAGVGFVLSGVQARTDAWFSPLSLLLLAAGLLALHLAGIGPRKP